MQGQGQNFMLGGGLDPRAWQAREREPITVIWGRNQGQIQEFWKGGLVRGRSPEPSAKGASVGGGSGGLPQKIMKN